MDAAPALSPLARAAGFSLEHHREAGSTNTLAKIALAGGADRRWIVADIQTAGRGRLDRGWLSPQGNLYASLALADPCAAKYLPLVGFVAGVALARSVHHLAPSLSARARLKWPNDLLVDGIKAAGILLESVPDTPGGPGLVLGIGVNIAAVPEGLDQPAAALGTCDAAITRDALFTALSESMIDSLRLFDRGAGFPALRDAWLALSLPIGQRMRVRQPDGIREGSFLGIGEAGGLEIETARGHETILAGDVFAL